MAENAGSSMVAFQGGQCGCQGLDIVTIGAKNFIGQSNYPTVWRQGGWTIGGGLFDGTSMKATLFILRVLTAVLSQLPQHKP